MYQKLVYKSWFLSIKIKEVSIRRWMLGRSSISQHFDRHTTPKLLTSMELETCMDRTWCIWIWTGRFVWRDEVEVGYRIEKGWFWGYPYICICGELRDCSATVTAGFQIYTYSNCMCYLALYKTVPRDFEWCGYVGWVIQAVDEEVIIRIKILVYLTSPNHTSIASTRLDIFIVCLCVSSRDTL